MTHQVWTDTFWPKCCSFASRIAALPLLDARNIQEAVLAHTLSDKTEAASQRGDLMEKPRRLMAEWANFGSRDLAVGDVLPLRPSA